MPEWKTEVKAFQVDYVCDECLGGKMVATGLMKPVYPPLYEHKCDCCGERKNLPQNYPTLKFE